MSRIRSAIARSVLGLPRPFLRRVLAMTLYRTHLKTPRYVDSVPPLWNVQIEIRTRCNGHCSFCAANINDESREDVQMSLEVFEKVMNDLKTMGFCGKLSFEVNSEPLLVKDLPLYVRVARERLPGAFLIIGTNGRSLTLEKARELVEAGIDKLTINHYSSGKSEDIPEKHRQVEAYIREQFGDVRVREEPVLGGERRSEEQKVFYFELNEREEDEVLLNRAGSAPNGVEIEASSLGYCHYPFEQLTITADGRAGKCCFDFYFADPMGSVMEQSVAEIWGGEHFRQVRENLLNGDRSSMVPCNTCDYAGVRKQNSPFGRTIYEEIVRR